MHEPAAVQQGGRSNPIRGAQVAAVVVVGLVAVAQRFLVLSSGLAVAKARQLCRKGESLTANCLPACLRAGTV
jgi:hypothetical protein